MLLQPTEQVSLQLPSIPYLPCGQPVIKSHSIIVLSKWLPGNWHSDNCYDLWIWMIKFSCWIKLSTCIYICILLYCIFFILYHWNHISLFFKTWRHRSQYQNEYLVFLTTRNRNVDIAGWNVHQILLFLCTAYMYRQRLTWVIICCVILFRHLWNKPNILNKPFKELEFHSTSISYLTGDNNFTKL